MADKSKIEWTEATWNPITGCSVVSPGCTNCYAMRLAGQRMRRHPSRKGLTRDTKAGPVWNGKVRFNEQWLDQPLRWERPRMIFVCAHGDLFHEAVPDEWVDRVFAVMALAPEHTFQVLTKRSTRMREYLAEKSRRLRIAEAIGSEPVDPLSFPPPAERADIECWPLPNVWLGASTEDQERFYERAPDIEALSRQGWITWLSYEPALGPLDAFDLLAEDGMPDRAAHGPWVDWIVAGGESGPGSRPASPQWFRDLRDQCAAVETPFFFKQWGDWVSVSEVEGDGPQFSFPDGRTVRRVGKKAAGATLDGRTHADYPPRG